VDRLFNPYVNASKQRVHGCDIELRSVLETAARGVFDVQFIGSRIGSNKLKVLSFLPGEQLAGSFGAPKVRANLNVAWRREDWRAALQGRYTSGFDDASGTDRVGSHMEWNAQVGYAGFRWLDLAVGVENLFDNRPPGAGTLQGFPPQYFDMRGRFFYLQARATLRAGDR
jgi:outer membrane receptor protein involved in Fe transport